MTNAYPEKPMVPYKKTSVEMPVVIGYLQGLSVDKEIKRMAYIMFRNESGNGNSGINNNYCGFQADSGRWAAIHDDKIVGVVQKVENGTGKTRLFLAFNDVGGCLDMLLERVQGRGLYIGGNTHKITNMAINSPNDLGRAYKKEWVSGSAKIEPSTTELNNFLSMYNQATKYFT